MSPSATSKQVPVSSEPGTLASEAAAAATGDGGFPTPANANIKEGGEGEELVEKDIRDRFKKMCEGYFESVSKKLVIEHNVCRFLFFHHRTGTDPLMWECSVCKSKTGRIMKHIFDRERYSKIDNKRMRR